MNAEFWCANLLVFLLVWMHKDWLDRQIKPIYIGWDPGYREFCARIEYLNNEIQTYFLIDTLADIESIKKSTTASEVEMRMQIHEANLRRIIGHE